MLNYKTNINLATMELARRQTKKYSKGYVKSLAILSLAYGLLETTTELEKDGTIKVEDNITQTTLNEYRKSLGERLFNFFKTRATLRKEVMIIQEKIFHIVTHSFIGKNIDLELVAIYLIQNLIEDEKVDNEIKEVIAKEELDYLIGLITELYDTALIKTIKTKVLQKQIAKDLYKEIK